jgi:DNA-binding SARP family transcriptional activator
VLGPFDVRRAGAAIMLPSRKSQALLAYIALKPGHPHAREKLAALLWGDRSDEQALHSLRQALVDIRKALSPFGANLMRVSAREIILDPIVEVDAVIFEMLVADGTSSVLKRAVELYRGDLLEGLNLREESWHGWLAAERHRLRELWMGALNKLLSNYTESGAIEAAIDTAGRLLTVDPLHEAVHRTLMQLYLQQGRRGAALKQYEGCVHVLQSELGVEPQPETKQLYDEALRTPAGMPPTSVTAPRPAGADRPTPPLVGRDADLEVLHRALAVASSGQGRIVVVSGEAGVGKSRLVEALLEDAKRQGAHIMVGRSHDMTRALTFGPWVEALRSALPLVRREAVNPSYAAWRADLGEVLREAAAPDTDTQRPAVNPLRIFAAIARLLTALASERPVVLVLEDLHWADEISLRLLAFVARWIASSRVLLVGTFREEEIPDAPSLSRTLQELEREPRFERLRLSRLSEPETLRLTRLLAPIAQPKAVLHWLEGHAWAMTEGNPFMIVEMVQALVEAKDIDSGSHPPMPVRVRQLVTGRLARLTDRARELAAVGAVIGREFDFHLICEASDVPERDTADGLRELVRYRVFEVDGETFRFSHDRIREVVYAELLPPRRRMLHTAVARALEAIHAQNLAPHDATLGTHYFNGEVWLSAARYLAKAAHRAKQRWAWDEALQWFEQALMALTHLPPTGDALWLAVDVRAGLADQWMWLGLEDERTACLLGEAATAVEALGNLRQTARILNIQANYLRLTGHYEAARETAHQVLAIAEQIDDPLRRISINITLGHTYYYLGDYGRALTYFEENIERCVGDLRHFRLGNGVPSVMCRSWAVRCLAELGEFATGITRGEEAIRIADEGDHPAARTTARLMLGALYRRQGRADKAVPMLEHAMELAEMWNLAPNYLHPVGVHVGMAYALVGRTGEAVRLVERAIETYHAKRQVPPLTDLAEVYLLAGRIDEAAEWATRALETSRTHHDRGTEARTLGVLADVVSRAPSGGAEAMALYRAAITHAVELGMKPLAAQCHLRLGALHRRLGELSPAREHLTTVGAAFESMGMALWSEHVRAELAQLE